jgi:hypothetical protein
MKTTHTSQLEAVPDMVVPVVPVKIQVAFNVTTHHEIVNHNGTHRRFPIIVAYALTDYRSQGQTISHAIVDLAPPLSGELSLFNICRVVVW